MGSPDWSIEHPYQAGRPGDRTLEAMARAPRYNRWIRERLVPWLGRRVLEVGCGTGTNNELMFDRELLVGVDVVDEYITAPQQAHAGLEHVTFLRRDLTESVAGLEGHRFDSAFSVNVFEHLADDLGALRAVHRLLEPGGTLALLVPALPFLTGPFDRALGHLRRYSKPGMAPKLETAGFRVEALRHTNPLGAVGGFANVKLLRQLGLRAVGLYEALVPTLAPVDRLAEPPFGLSLIAVGRKT